MKATIATNSSNSLKGFGFYLFHAQDKVNCVLSKKIVCFHFGNSKVTIKKFIKRVNKVREKGFDLQFFFRRLYKHR